MMMHDVRLSFMEAINGTSKKIRVHPNFNPVDVEFPAGIDSGQQILVDAGSDTQLVLTVTVEKHPIFRWKGLDIYVDTKIDMVDAALGGTTSVPSLEGKTQVTFHEGTQSGDRLRLRGKGVRVGAQRGDMYVGISVVIPSRLTDRQKELLIEFSKEERLKKAA